MNLPSTDTKSFSPPFYGPGESNSTSQSIKIYNVFTAGYFCTFEGMVAEETKDVMIRWCRLSLIVSGA